MSPRCAAWATPPGDCLIPATPTTLPAPGLPFALVFRSDVGSENVILKIASAYEAASKRRVPPPDFGPLPGEP